LRLAQALRVQRQNVVALVGGGGKTSALFCLGDELAGKGWRVVTTTSTHISVNQVALAAHAVILPVSEPPSAIHYPLPHAVGRRIRSADEPGQGPKA
jgi:probable selenium-dependent hydroxylase accessory protein YqeC